MSPDQLKTKLRERPFRPFRLYTTGGQHYDVPNPEWMLVLGQVTGVGVPGRSGDGELLVTIDNDHVTHLEPLIDGAPLA